MSLLSPQYQNEDAAREYLEAKLWPSGPFCPHCGVIENIYKLQSKPETKNKIRAGVYKCGGCRKQFTVTVGTVFEDSHIPLHKWLLATHLMCSSKKGISALQLQRELWGEDPLKKDKTGRPKLKGSYRTAWFMCHRVRWAMTQSPMSDEIRLGGAGGVVEVDETYVGGKEHGKPGMPGKDSKKTPVLALMERGGNVRSFPIERATLKNIKPIIQKHIDPATHLVTDESVLYYYDEARFLPAFDGQSLTQGIRAAR
jgi:transposase-like protein